MSVRRIDAGSGHRYQLDGRKADGVTTLIRDGMPKPALINWAAKATAAYAVDNWAELGDLPVSQRMETLRTAKDRDRDEAGRRGTEVHRLADRLSSGEEIEVPDELAGHVESAVRFLDEWAPTMLLREAVVASRAWNYCGTLDFVAELPDGRRCIGDYKTARSGIWAESALQLGAYANAEIYLDEHGDEQLMSALGIEIGLAVWIRGDGYDVYEVDLAEGYRIFQHVAWLARQQRGIRDRLISAPLDLARTQEANR